MSFFSFFFFLFFFFFCPFFFFFSFYQTKPNTTQHNAKATNKTIYEIPSFVLQDNTRNHGPGSQGSAVEADGAFGRLIGGEQAEAVVARMNTQPGGSRGSGFVSNPANFIRILSMKVRAADGTRLPLA